MQNHVGTPRKDRFGRERRPQQFIYDDDGNLVATGAQAIAMAMAMTPTEPSASRSIVPPAQRAAVRPVVGRAPRERTNTRARGSRRGQRAGSSSSDDPDPPRHAWRSRRDPWALTWAERQPVLWRFRAARCRLLEVREAIRMGVDR